MFDKYFYKTYTRQILSIDEGNVTDQGTPLKLYLTKKLSSVGLLLKLVLSTD